MTEAWIKGLTAAAVISALALTLAPKGPGYRTVKLACGAMTVIMLIMPLRDFDIDGFALFSAQLRYNGERIAERAGEDSLAVKRIIIQGRARAYILDKAAELGIRDPEAEVELSVRDGTPYPAAVRLRGSADGEARGRLARFIEGQLGIPEERQYWDTNDEN